MDIGVSLADLCGSYSILGSSTGSGIAVAVGSGELDLYAGDLTTRSFGVSRKNRVGIWLTTSNSLRHVESGDSAGVLWSSFGALDPGEWENSQGDAAEIAVYAQTCLNQTLIWH